MSKIEWNKVTWYSKLLAVIVFLATFYVAFNIGREWQALKDQPVAVHPAAPGKMLITSDVTFTCAAGKTIQAQFYENNVQLELSDGRYMTLPHALSADGARYANADESFVFWNKGQGAFITEGSSTGLEAQTYKDCVVTKQ